MASMAPLYPMTRRKSKFAHFSFRLKSKPNSPVRLSLNKILNFVFPFFLHYLDYWAFFWMLPLDVIFPVILSTVLCKWVTKLGVGSSVLVLRSFPLPRHTLRHILENLFYQNCTRSAYSYQTCNFCYLFTSTQRTDQTEITIIWKDQPTTLEKHIFVNH